jgi:predicted enzyme related to lactoylglutathione lyase
MESMIATMLGDFEQGRLTRRELIQGLAMIAAAGPAMAGQQAAGAKPAPPIPPAFEPTGWKTVWLDHISYAVADYRKSAAFYRDLMGWTIDNDNGTNQATLNINGIGGIIIRNRRDPNQAQAGSTGQAANTSTSAAGGAATGGGQTTPGGQGGQRTRPPLTGVINHISWGISNWNTEKVEAELKRRGLTPRPDMVGTDFKSFHVTDPDGWDLQISNQTK